MQAPWNPALSWLDRDFGIRLALGGSARDVIVTVARRALMQITIGVTWGAGVWVALMLSVLRAAPGSEAVKMRAPWPYVLGASVWSHRGRAGRRAVAHSAVRPHAARRDATEGRVEQAGASSSDS